MTMNPLCQLPNLISNCERVNVFNDEHMLNIVTSDDNENHDVFTEVQAAPIQFSACTP